MCVREREVKKEREKLESWGSLAGDHCQGCNYKMLLVTNSSHLGFSHSKGNEPQTIGHWSEASSPDCHDLRVRRCLPEDKMKSWKSSFKGARSNKRMCLLSGCSSSPYPHVLHLVLIIPTSSLRVPSCTRASYLDNHV